MKKIIKNPEYVEARWECSLLDKDGKIVEVPGGSFRYKDFTDYDPSDPSKNAVPMFIEVEDE